MIPEFNDCYLAGEKVPTRD